MSGTMTTAILPVKNETEASINRITKDGRELTYGNPLSIPCLILLTDDAQRSKSFNSRKGPEHVDLGQNVCIMNLLPTPGNH